MATLSPARKRIALLPGLELVGRGKVRDTYRLPSQVYLLPVATDGISIFDFVLDATVPGKGVILNALSHFWASFMSQFGIPTHFVAAGSAIDSFLPECLRGNVDLQSRASVVSALQMAPYEFIARAVLTGSALKGYRGNGLVCGQNVGPGLQDGDRLPFVALTPTTKEEEGHDLEVSCDEVWRRCPGQMEQLSRIFQIAHNFLLARGIFLADTKFEFGADGLLADEILTPDSSRFWEYAVWLKGRNDAVRKAPPPYDKQLVRAWGIEQEINKRDPTVPADVAFVHSLVVPEELIRQTVQVYRYIFWRITGQTIENYLCKQMNVGVKAPTKKVVIVCGSESDVPSVMGAIKGYAPDTLSIRLHVMSCHRNPLELARWCEKHEPCDVIIGIGGKALALPGIIDALINREGRVVPVAGVALGTPGSEDLLAAQLSIERLPGEPVVCDELTGRCYFGVDGLQVLLKRICAGELPPPKPRVRKEAKLDLWTNEMTAGSV